MASGSTMLIPHHGETPATGESQSIPTDLLQRFAARLRGVAIVYAATFFFANFVAGALAGQFRPMFASPGGWLPGAVSIVVGIIVAVAANPSRISARTLTILGPLFCVVGSYGIAFAEFWSSFSHREVVGPDGFFGLSWVAVWVVFYSIVVPQRPWRSFVASLLGGSAVFVVITLALRAAERSLGLPPSIVFVALVFPYIITAGMAAAGAHTIYTLGRDVREARELGSYRLVERLGEGGMGQVWRAEHRFLARPAAVKIMRPEMLARSATETHATLRHRFEREAQATATLESPHTINLYDFGTAANGEFYYAMELLQGRDLQTLVEGEGPLPAARVIYLLRQVCHSLGEAHEKGFIHRDVKPANVYVCRYGREFDFVKVLDFGLVKATHFDDPDRARLTAHVGAGGTPAFMAPEQVLGETPIDHRADLYAVGCVAYWLLTGRPVFEESTPMKVMMAHVQTPPVPPSNVAELRLPPGMDEIVMACLAKDPSDRPATADVLDDHLAACQAGEPWGREDAAAWWRLRVPGGAPATPTTV